LWGTNEFTSATKELWKWLKPIPNLPGGKGRQRGKTELPVRGGKPETQPLNGDVPALRKTDTKRNGGGKELWVRCLRKTDRAA